MEKTYGALMAEHRKITAERHFPKVHTRPSGGEGEGGEEGTPGKKPG